MAKRSKVVANERRAATVRRYARRRAELVAVLKSAAATPEQKAAARSELDRQPRDASRTRVRNRDAVDGRPRGYLRPFGLSRIRFRATAHRGELPGVTKSSW